MTTSIQELNMKDKRQFRCLPSCPSVSNRNNIKKAFGLFCLQYPNVKISQQICECLRPRNIRFWDNIHRDYSVAAPTIWTLSRRHVTNYSWWMVKTVLFQTVMLWFQQHFVNQILLNVFYVSPHNAKPFPKSLTYKFHALNAVSHV